MTNPDDPRPSPCPSWCDGIVCQEHFAADRYHQHDAVVPVICRDLVVVDGDLRAALGAGELTIALFTKASIEDGDHEIWVALEMAEAGRGFTLSLESVRRVCWRLGEVLDRV